MRIMKIKDYHSFNPDWDKGITRVETKTILKEYKLEMSIKDNYITQ